MIFKRKIYESLLKWKSTANGKWAVLIEGARRIGKSTIAEQFAKEQYKSYLLINFSIAPNEVKEVSLDFKAQDFMTGHTLADKYVIKSNSALIAKVLK